MSALTKEQEAWLAKQPPAKAAAWRAMHETREVYLQAKARADADPAVVAARAALAAAEAEANKGPAELFKIHGEAQAAFFAVEEDR